MIENKYEISKDLEKHYRHWSRLADVEVISYNKRTLSGSLRTRADIKLSVRQLAK